MTKGQGFGFGLGKMKELAEAFKKAQEVQQGAKQLQEELEQMEIEAHQPMAVSRLFLAATRNPCE
jgi:ribosomal protein S5